MVRNIHFKKYTSISEHFSIASQQIILTSPRTITDFGSENHKKGMLELQKKYSCEYLKPILTQIISDYIFIKRLNRGNILSLALYLHFSIFNTIEKLSSQKKLKKGQLLKSHINEIDNMYFSPEID